MVIKELSHIHLCAVELLVGGKTTGEVEDQLHLSRGTIDFWKHSKVFCKELSNAIITRAAIKNREEIDRKSGEIQGKPIGKGEVTPEKR